MNDSASADGIDANPTPDTIQAKTVVPAPGLGVVENRESAMTVNRLGVTLCIDNNFVGDESEAAQELRDLDDAGWIDLKRSDTVDTELGDTKDAAKRDALLKESSALPEALGPLVLDHSRLDFAVWGNEDDERRLEQVYAILFPDSDRHDASTGRSRRKIRDAMHVATAIRYGADVLVTRDEHDLVSKSEAIASEFDGFRIMSPEQACAFVRQMVRTMRE